MGATCDIDGRQQFVADQAWKSEEVLKTLDGNLAGE
jgi:hypothetical protein